MVSQLEADLMPRLSLPNLLALECEAAESLLPGFAGDATKMAEDLRERPKVGGLAGLA